MFVVWAVLSFGVGILATASDPTDPHLYDPDMRAGKYDSDSDPRYDDPKLKFCTKCLSFVYDFLK